MKNIIKTVSLLSMIAVIPGAMAATSRVSMISKASPRLPSIAGYIMSANNNLGGTTIAGGTTTVSYLADPDCINNYTDCIKSNDSCGSDFEECTTNILLHAKMPNCLSVLSQCTASGRNSLFGSSDMNAIATSATRNNDGEVTTYTYPTGSSILGQMVTAAQISNQLTTDQCVKKYTNCLKKDAVCGGDFELCTDNREFKNQAIACESTLARCQSAGKIELFGTTAAAASLAPAAGSRLAEMIAEGGALAVNNAVATCNKVTDQCILNACAKNPNKCIEGRPEILIRIADATNGGRAVTTQDLMEISRITEGRDITTYIRSECQQIVGSNKYCYMTVKGSVPTKASVLTDPDNVEEVFDDMYSGEFGRFAALGDKINQIIDKFDAKVQDKCIDTMTSCAMRSCGGGIGSVCYKQSRDMNNLDNDGSVNITRSPRSYQEVRSACRAIVDVDSNCQYAAVLSQGNLYNGYMSDENSVFTTLFPENSSTANDPIGVVATLYATLATSYNDAAIEKMKKQCQTTALGCVKSMCGKDYTNCYRNRTDIVSGTYDTGNVKLDRSMNKMGGVLDYNIVIGLCMNTVKNSSVCEEHLKVAAAEWRDSGMSDSTSWNPEGGNRYDSVRGGWIDANSTNVSSSTNNTVVIGCRIPESGATENCPAFATADDVDGRCDAVIDEDGCVYSEPITQSQAEYVLENAGKTLFQELLADVEKEAQAKYNAKLTKEQNVCLANNNGGIQGASDNGSTFMWVKLRNNKIPKTYNMKGLKANQFAASNDLYGSFCRARVTVVSDDKDIQDALGSDATAYFAVGDTFTCGSWISDKTLNKISQTVGERELCKQGYGKWEDGKCDGSKLSTKEKIAYAWGTVAPALGGMGLGLGLTESGLISKAIKKGNEKNNVSSGDSGKLDSYLKQCKKYADEAAGVAEEAAGAAKAKNKDTFPSKAKEAMNAADAAVLWCGRAGITSKEGCKRTKLDYNLKKAKNSNDGTLEEPTDQQQKDAEQLKADMIFLSSVCEDYVQYDETGKGNKAARVAIPIMTTLAGGALGAGITASVIKQKKENIQNEAAQKWMDEIGEHIQCFVGIDELGTYGDSVAIEID